jgi:ADP-ribosylglycohydrolase
MTPTSASQDRAAPRPIDESYWVVPGRLLVGAHPGAKSRAQAIDRIRRFIAAGLTYFIDLTEPQETPDYETLLPQRADGGRPIVYRRESILDHDVPAGAEQMTRIIALIDEALAAEHNVYLHCRAGIGRSATAVGCWLAEKRGDARKALAEMQVLWHQSSQSDVWAHVPETDNQFDFVLRWLDRQASPAIPAAVESAAKPAQRVVGAWLGLAIGDAMGAAHARGTATGAALQWTQSTALALCLAESLLELERFDARDQIERYVRWHRDGYCAPDGAPGEPHVTPDIGKALATYRWRGLPMAGSHDPRDVAATSLSRTLAPVVVSSRDPVAAVALACECSRTTHQSPIILDACRWYGAMLLCALQGQPAESWLKGLCEPAPGDVWSKPLRKEVLATARQKAVPVHVGGAPLNVLQVLSHARATVLAEDDFEEAIAVACRIGGASASLLAAVTGTLFGMRHGSERVPDARRAELIGHSKIEAVAERCILRGLAAPVAG